MILEDMARQLARNIGYIHGWLAQPYRDHRTAMLELDVNANARKGHQAFTKMKAGLIKARAACVDLEREAAKVSKELYE